MMNIYENPLADGIIREGLIKLEGLSFNTKFWAKDASLWKQDKASQDFIVQFLGWQKVYDWTLERLDEVIGFAQDVQANFKHCVVMGMGGSSLAPEVFRTVFGKQEGWPELLVLDTKVADENMSDLMDMVENMKGEVMVISSEHEGGKQLESLGGMAAILRYEIA